MRCLDARPNMSVSSPLTLLLLSLCLCEGFHGSVGVPLLRGSRAVPPLRAIAPDVGTDAVQPKVETDESAREVDGSSVADRIDAVMDGRVRPIITEKPSIAVDPRDPLPPDGFTWSSADSAAVAVNWADASANAAALDLTKTAMDG